MPPPTNAQSEILTPAARLLGRRWIAFDSETGAARPSFFAPPEFANRHGSVHGGFLAAMLDSAASMAILETLPPDLTMVTARLDTEFLKPAPLGPLDACARIVERDDRDVSIAAELTAPDGTIVARAQVTMRIIKRRAKTAVPQ
jgi:uncharacterized protein (TIGR00369 family)